MSEPITPSSVEDLLRELQPLLPGTWGARVLGGNEIEFTSPRTHVERFLNLKSDEDDAKAIVMLLDLLESLGWVVSLTTHPVGEEDEKYQVILWEGKAWHSDYYGKTRSEAVTRAVLAVLQQDSSPTNVQEGDKRD